MLDLQYIWHGTGFTHTMQGLCESTAGSFVPSATAAHYVLPFIIDDISPLYPVSTPSVGYLPLPTSASITLLTGLSDIAIILSSFSDFLD